MMAASKLVLSTVSKPLWPLRPTRYSLSASACVRSINSYENTSTCYERHQLTQEGLTAWNVLIGDSWLKIGDLTLRDPYPRQLVA